MAAVLSVGWNHINKEHTLCEHLKSLLMLQQCQHANTEGATCHSRLLCREKLRLLTVPQNEMVFKDNMARHIDS